MIPFAHLFDPAALTIVGGGTILSAFLRSPMHDLGRALRALPTLGRRRYSAEPALAQIASLSRIARRSGVIALDRSIIADPDIAGAIAIIVDGGTPESVAALVAWRRRARCERHAAAADVWAAAAEAAPAMGMVGTLIGLAAMFAAMRDPATIGAAMAIALLSTLYGALLGNLVFLPLASRLRAAARIEGFERARFEAPLVALAAREAPMLGMANAA